MKKITLFLLSLFHFAGIAFAQTFNSVKIDTITGNVIFDEIVKVDSAKKDELYLKAKEWFAMNFKSANSVIQLDDKESGKLVGKGLQKIWDGYAIMFFTISISVRENRYKYSVENIKLKTNPNQYNLNPPEYSAEDLITDSAIEKKRSFNEHTKKQKIRYKEETLKAVNEISESIKKAMKNSVSSGNDW